MKKIVSAKGGSSLVQQKLDKLGLREPQDLILHLPIRYEDETSISPISSLVPGQSFQVEGEVLRSDVSYRPRKQLTATLADQTGQLNLRWLHFYPSQIQQVQQGNRLRAMGEVRTSMFGLEMVHPKTSSPTTPLPAALTPVYPTTEGLTQASLRKQISNSLIEADLSDTLPDSMLRAWKLCSFSEAIRTLHAPSPNENASSLTEHTHPAWIRVKFDELLAQQLSLAAARQARRAKRAMPLPRKSTRQSLVKRLLAAIPFSLTDAQSRVVGEIGEDMSQPHPMHRLLQGDVGSGKTIVAALAAMQAIDHGVQVAVMAPTEILAQQHYQKLSAWCEPIGIRVCWLTGSLTAKAKRLAVSDIQSGAAQLIVGTQAIIQDKVDFHHLGLVIVDEQHRFGVEQRLALSRKGETPIGEGGFDESTRPGWAKDGCVPHQLSMSATPIPRTLAMTFYADLDVSVIDQLPPGRSPVLTKLISSVRREEVIAHVGQEAASGKQVYWVCPLVEESEALDLQTAVDTYELLCADLAEISVGLVHGRMPPSEKAAVMEAFRAGDIRVLVATTVIEVGVDVPNASLMIIEHAERFGLAQLHQLRGRVGRGQAKSVCVLMYQHPLSMLARQRLRAMYETQDGFEIAQRDLELRGPGEFLGARQSGVTLLKFADLAQDSELVRAARESAAQLISNHPDVVQRHLARWLRGRQDFMRS